MTAHDQKAPNPAAIAHADSYSAAVKARGGCSHPGLAELFLLELDPEASRDDIRPGFLSEVVDAISGAQVIMLHVPALAEELTEGCAADVDAIGRGLGTAIFFEDATCVYLNQAGILAQPEAVLDWKAVRLAGCLDPQRSRTLLAASRDLRVNLGDLDQVAAALSNPSLERDIVDALLEIVPEDRDEIATSELLEDKQNWTPEDVEGFEAALIEAYLALDIREDVEVMLQSGTMSQEASFEILTLDTPATDRLCLLINKLVDISRFFGSTYEYDRGPMNRMSSYLLRPQVVSSFTLSVSDYSAHQRLEARTSMPQRLRARGLDEAQVALLLSPLQDGSDA